MPNCDWYGTRADHRPLLEWLFADDGCDVMESYSKFERPIERYRSADEVLAEFDKTFRGGKAVHSVHLALWPRNCGPCVPVSRFALDPACCGGATWRDCCDGTCVQFYLQDVSAGRLDNSHTNTPSTQRMGAKDGKVAGPNGDVWDIGAINRFSARLNRQIMSRAVARIGVRSVMAGAALAWSQSVQLGHYKPDEHAGLFQGV